MSGPLAVVFIEFSCVFLHFLSKTVLMVGAILFLFVWYFHFVTSAFVITMASASQYDSRRHDNVAQTRQNVFHVDSDVTFGFINVKHPYLVSY